MRFLLRLLGPRGATVHRTSRGRHALRVVLCCAWWCISPAGAPTPQASAQGAAVDEDFPAVNYRLAMGRGRPGDVVDLVLTLSSQQPLQAVSVAIAFDPTFLVAESVTRLTAGFQDPGEPPDPGPPPALPAGLLEVVINNPPREAAAVPGEEAPPADDLLDALDQAFVYVRLQGADGLPLFADGAVELELAVVFTLLEVPDEVELPLAIPIRFEAIGGEVPEALENAVLDNVVEDADTVDGPEARRPVPQQDLEDGQIIILGLGEIGFFRRADANQDCAVDLSDSLFTFDRLFRSTLPVPCQDAADSNDDGFADVSDGIFTLQWLFQEGSAPPPPLYYGLDATPDELHCESSYERSCFRGT